MTNIGKTITSINGFKAAGVRCGIKKKNNALDFALIAADAPCTAAGLFTKSYVKAAPVLLDMERLYTNAHSIRAVAINSGNANACTGQQGMENAQQTARYVAEKIGCDENEVLVMSTGVIGQQLPMDKIKRGVDLAGGYLGNYWNNAARAIMTTDTRTKIASTTASVGENTYCVAGIAKGAGMIAPNMATMLSIIMTDAPLGSPADAHNALLTAAQKSFNRIVIDGDMSTNDTVLLLSSSQQQDTPPDAAVQTALNDVCLQLALDIVRDGEGATKLIKIVVSGTENNEQAHQIANTIAVSPLVKTAFYGSDANWGRIIMAVGRAGVPVDMDKISLSIKPGLGDDVDNKLDLLQSGQPCPYREEDAATIMKHGETSLYVDCGGNPLVSDWVYTCDLSHDYISINADYRT